MKGERENGVQARDWHIVVEPNGAVRELFNRSMDSIHRGPVTEGGRRKNKKVQVRYTPKR